MPLYQHIVVAFPKFKRSALVELFQRMTAVVIKEGGVVRGIENHGIRPLAEKAKRYVSTFFFRFI